MIIKDCNKYESDKYKKLETLKVKINSESSSNCTKRHPLDDLGVTIKVSDFQNP